jgi:hypothetical protein
MFNWLELLFWEIGQMTIQFLIGNVKGAIEMIYWIKIHFLYRGECVKESNLPVVLIIKNKCIEIIGVIIVFGFLFMVGNLMSNIIK